MSNANDKAINKLADELGDAVIERLSQDLVEGRAQLERVTAAVRHHHDQSGDNRCRLDDLKLYHDVLGEGVDPYVGALPHDADMEESCRRYIRQRRCPGPQGVVPLPGEMTIQQLTDEVVRHAEDNARLRNAYARENDEICQTLAAALEGYPRYCDDQVNFPGATEADGVCVGEHVAATLAMEAAERIKQVTSERDSLITSLNSYTNTGSGIFAEINTFVAQAIGHSIESGHTAVYAVELLATKLGEVTAERDKANQGCERLGVELTRATTEFAKESHRLHSTLVSIHAITTDLYQTASDYVLPCEPVRSAVARICDKAAAAIAPPDAAVSEPD